MHKFEEIKIHLIFCLDGMDDGFKVFRNAMRSNRRKELMELSRDCRNGNPVNLDRCLL